MWENQVWLLDWEDPLDSHLLQYSCLENPMNRGAWRAIVHGVTYTHTTNIHTHTHTNERHDIKIGLILLKQNSFKTRFFLKQRAQGKLFLCSASSPGLSPLTLNHSHGSGKQPASPGNRFLVKRVLSLDADLWACRVRAHLPTAGWHFTPQILRLPPWGLQPFPSQEQGLALVSEALLKRKSRASGEYC